LEPEEPAPPLDDTRPVRPGEELPVEALARWLGEHLPPGAGGAERGAPLAVSQFPGGHSNLTYLLRWGERELVLRRPPVGSTVKTAHDMGRELRVLTKLAPVYPKAPRPLLGCDDPAVLGAPFYLMERVRGVVLRDRRAAGMDIPPARMRRLSEAAVDGLAELHAIDLDAAGLGHPAGYAARQVAGWRERWRAARTDDVPEIDRAFAWLESRVPPETLPPALLHNDYKYDNLVFAPDLSRVVAVLDWEMATTGDPRMDLGYALACWVDPDDAPPLQALAFGPTARPGNLSRAEVAARYAGATGRGAGDLGDLLFFYVFGLAKLAVIAQQIYARYRRGLTHDDRFARLLDGVRILGATAAKAIAKGRIDRLEG
jgi:aminoglycoside phosphotransferase (APT) family kinase protein